MAYSKYIPENERPVITGLLKGLLAEDYAVSVHDSEEWVVIRSKSFNEIRDSLGGSGEDVLRVRDSDGEYVGMFYLIYNNGSEQDPMIVIADYSVTDTFDRIVEELTAKYGE